MDGDSRGVNDHRISFGAFEADLKSGELRRKGIRLKLPEQPFKVLVILLERAGEVVTREDLRRQIWPNDVFVDFDQGLNKAVNRVREVLGDSANNPRFIETIPRRGYRFIAPVVHCGSIKDTDAAAELSVQSEQNLVPNPTTKLLSRAPSTSVSPTKSPKRIKLFRLWYALAAIVLVCLAALSWHRSVTVTAPVKFIAIMPFSTASNSPELDYMADGITESVINDLSQLRQVRVMARSTVYRYRARGLDPMAAAVEMKVHAILTGTISKRGDKFLVVAELVGVPEGTRLWGKQYELSAKELVSIQDRIALGIATSLELRLGSDDRARLLQSQPSDPEAYRLYLQARFFWNQRSKEGYLKSIELFQAAIARDPTYARAYAGLSDSYSFLGRDEAPTSEYMPKARAAVERALSLDDGLGEAHASLAMMTFVNEWNFKAAEHEYRRALDLDPSYATGHHLYGMYLASQGDFKQSQSQLDQAAQLDPLSPIIALCRGYPESYQGHIEPAIRAAEEALEMSPSFDPAIEDLMIYYERQGRQEAAMQQAVALLHVRGEHQLADAVQAANRRSGYRAALRTWFEAEEKRAAREYVSPLRIAILAMRAGDMDKAFAWLDEAINARNAGLVYLTVDPKYARLRSDPRFARVCERVGLNQRNR